MKLSTLVVSLVRAKHASPLPLILALVLIAPAFAADIPSVTDAEVEQALKLAGSNRGELEHALDAGIQKPYTMQALRFIIVSLPLADLGKISSAELVQHVELGMQARGEFAYGSQYDDATFAHYVLPPRVSQEPLSAWRPYFYNELKGVVLGSGDVPSLTNQRPEAAATSLEEAAVRVNRWCGAHARFQQTQSRDQGPLSTLASGYGRCEELCILLIDACRAVGIPARMAYCPWWAVNDNNHAWIEIYGSDGRWHYCGGAEPADTLDQAWFGGAVKSAPIILSPCFGLPGPDEDLSNVLDLQAAAGARFCRINSTRFYRQTGWLELNVPMDQAGGGLTQQPVMEKPRPPGSPEPAPELEAHYYVNVHVFNYGALRSVAKVELDRAGHARIELGVGDYTLTTNVPDAQTELHVSVKAGETVQVRWPAASAEADDRDAAPQSFVLQFPADQP